MRRPSGQELLGPTRPGSGVDAAARWAAGVAPFRAGLVSASRIPPFESNKTPAIKNVLVMSRRVRKRRGRNPDSKSLTVRRATAALRAKSRCVHRSKARAMRHCAGEMALSVGAGLNCPFERSGVGITNLYQIESGPTVQNRTRGNKNVEPLTAPLRRSSAARWDGPATLARHRLAAAWMVLWPRTLARYRSLRHVARLGGLNRWRMRVVSAAHGATEGIAQPDGQQKPGPQTGEQPSTP